MKLGMTLPLPPLQVTVTVCPAEIALPSASTMEPIMMFTLVMGVSGCIHVASCNELQLTAADDAVSTHDEVVEHHEHAVKDRHAEHDPALEQGLSEVHVCPSPLKPLGQEHCM